MIIIVQRMRQHLITEFTALRLQRFVGERLVAAHQRAVGAAAWSALAQTVLHRLHLHVVPVTPERREDAAVVRHIAVPVGGTFPHTHGGQMRRLERGDLPLIDAVVGNAIEPDLAAGPRLHPGPFDALVEISRLARRKRIDEARRATGAARIHAHAGVAVRHPLFRINHFPALVEVAGAVRDVRVFGHHAVPR